MFTHVNGKEKEMQGNHDHRSQGSGSVCRERTIHLGGVPPRVSVVLAMLYFSDYNLWAKSFLLPVCV